MKHFAILAVLSASSLAGSAGGNVTIEVRTVRIPAANFLEKMPKLLTQGAFVAEMWDLAGADDVALVGISSITRELANGKVPSDSVINTRKEIRYPTSWGVPLVPIRWVNLPSYVYRAHGTTGFEVKNIGAGLSITASPATDGRVALQINYQSTGKPAFKTYPAAFPGDVKLLMAEPDFKTSKFAADLRMSKGETRLIGTARAEKPGFFDLTLLRLISHNP